MSISWGAIVALIYIVIHVVSYIAKESAKRKEKERRMAEAERQRIATARMEAPAPIMPQTLRPSDRPGVVEQRGATSQQPKQIRIGRSVDDLAARRKQQIDQLRERAGLRTGPARTPTHGGVAQQGGAVNRGELQRVEMERKRSQQEEARKRAEKQAQAQRQRAAAEQQRQIREMQQVVQKSAVAAVPVARTLAAEAVVARAIGGATAPSRSGRMLQRLKSRATLRELMVMKEIIDRPVALRDPVN